MSTRVPFNLDDRISKLFNCKYLPENAQSILNSEGIHFDNMNEIRSNINNWSIYTQNFQNSALKPAHLERLKIYFKKLDFEYKQFNINRKTIRNKFVASELKKLNTF